MSYSAAHPRIGRKPNFHLFTSKLRNHTKIEQLNKVLLPNYNIDRNNADLDRNNKAIYHSDF